MDPLPFTPIVPPRSLSKSVTPPSQNTVIVASNVRLVNYPCVVQHAPGYAHRGHASHIDKVGFLAEDYRVVSCGGNDQATYQWRIRGPGKPPPPSVDSEPVAEQ